MDNEPPLTPAPYEYDTPESLLFQYRFNVALARELVAAVLHSTSVVSRKIP